METSDWPATTLGDYRREVLRKGFRNALAHGQVQPLLLPWCLVPSFVLPVLYLAFSHVASDGTDRDGGRTTCFRRRALRQLRIPLAVLIVALNARMLPSPWWASTSSANMACAYAVGLIASWGSLWALTVLLWTDPQRDAERVERRRRLPSGQPQNPCELKKSKELGEIEAPDSSVAQSLREGYSYFWQAFPADAPFLTRLDWAVDICLAWRGVGWNWCIAQVPRFRSPARAHTAEPVQLDSIVTKTAAGYRRHRSYAAFVSARLLASVVSYLVLDVAAVVMTMDPYFVFGPPPDPTLPWSEQAHLLSPSSSLPSPPPPPPPALLVLPPPLVFIYRHPALLSVFHSTLGLVGIAAALYMFFSLNQLLCVLVLGRRGLLHWLFGLSTTRAELWHYPSIFGGIAQVLDHGLAGFWGSLWHQTFRVAFVAPTAWLVRSNVLSAPSVKGQGQGSSTRAVGLVVAFLESAILHAAGSSTGAGRSHTFWWQQPLFFILAGAGIALQDLLCRGLLAPIVRRLGLHPSRFWRRGGNLLFTAAWLQATHHLFIDDLCRSGVWLFEPVPFSPIRWALYGGRGSSDNPLVGSSRAGNAAWRWYADDLPYWYVGEHWWNTGLAV